MDIQNIDGMMPKDLALFHKNEQDRVRLMILLNKDFSQTIRGGGNLAVGGGSSCNVNNNYGEL